MLSNDIAAWWWWDRGKRVPGTAADGTESTDRHARGNSCMARMSCSKHFEKICKSCTWMCKFKIAVMQIWNYDVFGVPFFVSSFVVSERATVCKIRCTRYATVEGSLELSVTGGFYYIPGGNGSSIC